MSRIGPAIQILNVVAATLHMLEHVSIENFELLGFHPGVIVPPDVRLDGRRGDDVLILGRPAGVLAGGHQKCTTLAHRAFAIDQGGLHQVRFGLVVIDFAQPGDALRFECHLWIDATLVHLLAPVKALPRAE